jgi:hypothetical protein
VMASDMTKWYPLFSATDTDGRAVTAVWTTAQAAAR